MSLNTADSKLEILLKEYELTCGVIEKFVGNQFYHTQSTLVLFGGYVYFLIEQTSDNSEEIKFYIQFLPLVLLIIFTALAYQYQRIIGLQGYKKYLSDQLNELMEERLISYAYIGNHYLVGTKSIIVLLNSLLFLIIYSASVLLAYIKPEEPVASGWWLVAHVFAGLLCFGASFYSIATFSNKVQNKATAIHKLKKLDIQTILKTDTTQSDKKAKKSKR